MEPFDAARAWLVTEADKEETAHLSATSGLRMAAEKEPSDRTAFALTLH